MVREHQIHTASVDVKLFSQVLLPHHAALQVPAGEAVSPGAGPAHDVLRLGLLPKGEVEGGVLVSLAVQAAGAFQGVVQVSAAQNTVMVVLVVLLHIEIDGAVALISIPGRQNLLDSLYLLDDMGRCAGFDGGRLHVQKAHGLVVALRVVLHHLHRLQLFQPGLLGNLVLPFVGIVLQVTYICNVTDIAHLVAQVLEQAEQDIVRHSRTGVTQVGISVHGGAAHVHSYMALVNGFEEFLVPGKGIGKV